MLVACGLGSVLFARQSGDVTNGTRLAGLRTGPHAVGFELKTAVDLTRHVSRSNEGTTIGIAIWYPARAEATRGVALTALDYRVLEFATPLTDHERQLYEQNEVDALVGWRHVGIVALAENDARASLQTHGVAVRGAPPSAGRHPVVMLLGGRYYLSTTAELLASHGFLVVAPFRFADTQNDIGTDRSSWYLENAVRDAEWALNVLRDDARADIRHVSAIGHGGGGLQAMLFAMRNTLVQAVINIDAGNFSSRSQARDLPFYSPRLMRAPFLYVATAATKSSQDQFEDFQAMIFSPRIEVVLESGEIRHHDLSDLGRAVTEPMHIRGGAQLDVQRAYVDVHEMAVRFLLEHASRNERGEESFAAWIAAKHAPGTYAVTVHSRVEAAPGTVDMLQTLDRTTPTRLRAAHRSDPAAPLFQPTSLARMTAKALAAGDFLTAAAIADVAVELHPDSSVLREQKAAALEGAGALPKALAEAKACAALSPGDDWQAGIAVRRCTQHVARLTKVVDGRRDGR